MPLLKMEFVNELRSDSPNITGAFIAALNSYMQNAQEPQFQTFLELLQVLPPDARLICGL